MVGVNFAVLVGNVGRDPELHNTQSGGRLARFSIATSESWKDRNTGERKERTEWHTVIVFSEGLVGVVEKYVRKGSRLYIQGTIRTREWEDQSGNRRWSTEIHLSGFDAKLVLLDKAAGQGHATLPSDTEDYGPGPGSYRTGNVGSADLDDEIPF